MNLVHYCILTACALIKRSGVLGVLMIPGLALGTPAPVNIQATPQELNILDEQRALFVSAEKAIRTGQLKQYKKMESQLKDYPLYPYLQAEVLKRRLSSAPDDEVLNFLETYDNSPSADKLRQRWINVLMRKGKYDTVVNNFRPTETVSQLCHYANALMRTDQNQQGYELMKDIWLTGRSLPDECDAPIKIWSQANCLSKDLVWQRIELVMTKRNHRLATWLAKTLPASDRKWLDTWKSVQRNPELVIKNRTKFEDRDIDNPVVLSILADGIKRLAFRKPLEAAQYWKEIKDDYFFEAIQKENIEHNLAQSLANVSSPVAYNTLTELDINNAGPDVIEPHVFSAMQNKEWSSALAWMDHLSNEEKNSERWQYWRARILESMRYYGASQEIYRAISTNRSYYSFLAADRIGSQYEILHRPLNTPEIKLIELQKMPSLARAYELLQLKRNTSARIEWHYAINSMDQEQLLMAAQLADKWGWNNRSIPTLAKAQYWDEIELRFPLTHRDHIINQAREEGINPAWAFAVIRQESAFVIDARSPAGAMGLMQLMPTTARHVARSMRIKRPRSYDLLDSDFNIKLGINYLKKLQKDFSGNTVLATAAYNAGPGKVNRWRSNYNTANTDLWIEMVPYPETRDYLKRVLTYTVIYEQRLGIKSSSMFDHLTPATTDLTAAVF